METPTLKLTTAAEILAAFNAVASDKEIDSKPESVLLLKDLTTLFLVKPAEEIVECVLTDAGAVNQNMMKMFNLYPGGSEEEKAVVAKRVSLVDEFVKAGNLAAADAWLERGYNEYPRGSEERKAVVAKGVSLADKFVKAGMFDAADGWLERGCNEYLYGGSEEEKAMAAKQEQLRQLRSSQQLGAIQKIDIAGLRRVIKQELAKLPVASVGH